MAHVVFIGGGGGRFVVVFLGENATENREHYKQDGQ